VTHVEGSLVGAAEADLAKPAALAVARGMADRRAGRGFLLEFNFVTVDERGPLRAAGWYGWPKSGNARLTSAAASSSRQEALTRLPMLSVWSRSLGMH
jgi:hypothetical protein